MIKIRVFRPSHGRTRTGHVRSEAAAVMDRARAFPAAGARCSPRCAPRLRLEERPKVVDYVYGLGGRDITVDDFKKIYGGCLILPKRAYGWFYSHIGQREEGGDR